TMQQTIAQRESRKIDFTISTNLSVVEDLLRENGSIDYSQVKFDSNNLLANINLLLGDNKNAANRNEIIVNLYAKLLETYGNKLKSTFSTLLRILSNARKDGNIALYSEVLELSNFVSILDGKAEQGSDRIYFGINADSKNVVV